MAIHLQGTDTSFHKKNAGRWAYYDVTEIDM